MEMAEHRDDGIWEVVPTRSYPWHIAGPEGERRRRHRPRLLRAHRGDTPVVPAPRPRLVGWSLVFVALSNGALVATILLVGMSPVGLTACAALALSSWLLVVAELLSLRRLYGRAP